MVTASERNDLENFKFGGTQPDNIFVKTGLNDGSGSAISLTGKTKIVLRNKNYDIDDTAPTDAQQRYVIIQMVETALATSDPYIEVTYTPGVASTQAPRQEEVMWFN